MAAVLAIVMFVAAAAIIAVAIVALSTSNRRLTQALVDQTAKADAAARKTGEAVSALRLILYRTQPQLDERDRLEIELAIHDLEKKTP